MNMKLVGLLLSVYCLTPLSLAQDVSPGYQAYGPELTNKREIARIDVTESGLIRFISKNGKWGKASCPDANHADVSPSHKAYREIYAQGLAAQMDGSQVFFYAVCTSHPLIINIKNMYKE